MNYSNEEIKQKLQDWCDKYEADIQVLSVGLDGGSVAPGQFIITAKLKGKIDIPLDYANYVDNEFYYRFNEAAEGKIGQQKEVVRIIKGELEKGVFERKVTK